MSDVGRWWEEKHWNEPLVLLHKVADAWDECAKEARDLGWIHDAAMEDMIARNPYRRMP